MYTKNKIVSFGKWVLFCSLKFFFFILRFFLFFFFFVKYHFGALECFVSGLGEGPSKAQLSAFGQGARH